MGSYPVISTPSMGHEHLSEVSRIHPAIPPGGISPLNLAGLASHMGDYF